MIEAERHKASDPEPWRAPVDALIENARRAELLGAADDDGTTANSRLRQLRGDWRNYLSLIQETLQGSSNPAAHAIRDARRRLLAALQSLEPSWQKWREIGRLNPVTTNPEELERRVNAAEREHNLQLYERRLKDAMRDELRSGHWEGEDLLGIIPDRIWSLRQLHIDWANATIQIGDEPPRYGLRLRPRRIEEAPLERPPASQPAELDEEPEQQAPEPVIPPIVVGPSPPVKRARPGPRPGEINYIQRQRLKLIERLQRMQRGRYKNERDSKTLDRFLDTRKAYKLPGDSREDLYKRQQLLREWRSLKRKKKSNS